MTDEPLCECHGKPMVRRTRKGSKTGFGWLCRVKCADRQRRYVARNPEKRRAIQARTNGRRVLVGDANAGGYFGLAETPERAAEINARGRGMLADFKESQKEARIAAGS